MRDRRRKERTERERRGENIRQRGKKEEKMQWKEEKDETFTKEETEGLRERVRRRDMSEREKKRWQREY